MERSGLFESLNPCSDNTRHRLRTRHRLSLDGTAYARPNTPSRSHRGRRGPHRDASANCGPRSGPWFAPYRCSPSDRYARHRALAFSNRDRPERPRHSHAPGREIAPTAEACARAAREFGLGRFGRCDRNGRYRALPFSSRGGPERPRHAHGLALEIAPIAAAFALAGPGQFGPGWEAETSPPLERKRDTGLRSRAIRRAGAVRA